ncbi:hypothetical protein Tco_0511651 [Tanacetum coccineum]
MEKRQRQVHTSHSKTPKEILALEKGKFKTPPPMITPVEKRNANKFYEFHGEVGHNTDECNHLRKQIKDMLKAGKLSHIIRELKQNSRKEQPKKKGETSGKEKPQAILMIHIDGLHGGESTSPFNGIIERPGLGKMKAVPSTIHGMIKFPVMGGILTLRSSKIIPIECAMVSGPEDQPPPMNKVKEEIQSGNQS